jgi:hypothetical protein
MEYCPTGDMISDFFIKPLQGALFQSLRNLIMDILMVSTSQIEGVCWTNVLRRAGERLPLHRRSARILYRPKDGVIVVVVVPRIHPQPNLRGYAFCCRDLLNRPVSLVDCCLSLNDKVAQQRHDGK